LSSLILLARLPIRLVERHKASGTIVIQTSVLVQRITKALVTSAVDLKATSNWNLRLPPYTSLDLDLDLELSSNLDYLDLELSSNSDYLDLYLDPNIEPDTEPNTNNEPDINKHPDLELGLEDLGLDSKAKEILKDIAKLRDKGLAKPNYTSYIKKL
jgi:hypothetical protein